MLRPRVVGLLLTFVTLLVYVQTTFDQFINFDDPVYVLDNPFVNKGFTILGIKWAFVSGHACNWHPLTWMSHMLDCELFHLNPAGPHLLNCLVHAVNAGLLFALLLRWTNPCTDGEDSARSPEYLWPSAFVAALFAWHPLHVESVAWISERKDVLSTFFSLLSLLSYTQYARARSKSTAVGSGNPVQTAGRNYAMALVYFALALLSKPMQVTLPAVMLLLDFWPLDRFRRTENRLATVAKLFAEKVPFFILSGVVCLITILVQKHAESTLANVPISLRLENVVVSYVAYLGKMLWPLRLGILYPYSGAISGTLLAESGLLLAAISVLAWRLRRDHPYLITGWLWYLITLLPVIGLIQVGSQSMADRYTYFPLIGIFLATAFSMHSLARHFEWLKKWLVGVAVTALAACVLLTERQLGYWHDSEVLFQHAVEVDDNDTARISLGSAFLEKNETKQAMTQFLIAWRMRPDSVLANMDVAGILDGENKTELAAAFLKRATIHNSWMPVAYQNFGRELVTLKRYDEAMTAFSTAAQIDPESAVPHLLMGRLLLKEGRDQQAVNELNKAMDLEPQNLENIMFAATVLASCDDSNIRDGRRAKALAQNAVAATQGQQAAALDVLAMCSAELGRFPDAILIEQQALQAAETAHQQDGLDLLQKHLESYQKRQPWRETFKIK